MTVLRELILECGGVCHAYAGINMSAFRDTSGA
jgi:hypothetical protein